MPVKAGQNRGPAALPPRTRLDLLSLRVTSFRRPWRRRAAVLYFRKPVFDRWLLRTYRGVLAPAVMTGVRIAERPPGRPSLPPDSMPASRRW